MASLRVATSSEVHEFICYITRDIMVDPVLAMDGHSYERSAIERWYETHTTSPVTNENIGKTLVPNHNLRKMIQDWQVAKEKFENDIGELAGRLFNASSIEKALDYVRRMSSLIESIDLVDPMMLNKCKKATVADDAVLEGDVQVALEALVVQCEAKMLEGEEKLRREAEEKVLREAARARNEELYEACKESALTEVCTALEVDGGVDVNYRGDGGRTPLYWASTKGHVDVVRHLLSVKDIQVNQARDDGVTALFMASQKGHVDVVRLLLGAEGIEVNQADNDGTTALYMASQNGHVNVVRLLLGAEGVEVNQAMNDGVTALYMASQNGFVEIVRLLLSPIAADIFNLGAEGVEVNQAGDDGVTALLVASREGHVEVVRLLLGVEGVEVNQVDNDGITALRIASHQGHIDVVRLLTDAGAN